MHLMRRLSKEFLPFRFAFAGLCLYRVYVKRATSRRCCFLGSPLVHGFWRTADSECLEPGGVCIHRHGVELGVEEPERKARNETNGRNAIYVIKRKPQGAGEKRIPMTSLHVTYVCNKNAQMYLCMVYWLGTALPSRMCASLQASLYPYNRRRGIDPPDSREKHMHWGCLRNESAYVAMGRTPRSRRL
jgi:hypothetical protein